MAGINVGSVLVDVLPDARGWDEKLSAQIAPAAEAVGKKISQSIEDDIADGARKGAERAKIDLATIGDATINVDVDNTAALAKLAEVDVAAKEAQRSAVSSTGGMGGLIAAAVAGGLMLGGPAIVGAAGVAAAGVAAVFLHNQQDVANAASEMGAQVTQAYQGVADAAVPDLVLALGKLRNAAFDLVPQVHDLFSAVGPAIQGVTDGIIGLAQGAIPGLISMVKSGAPVFDGLKNFLTDVGSGLGSMFQILSEHSSAFGQVFTSLGDVIHTLLPALGDLVAAGGELGSAILPPLATVLGVVGSALHAIAPILPEIAAGFAAFKVAGLIASMLGSLAGGLESVGAKAVGLSLLGAAGATAGSGLEVAAAGARGLEAAMGPIGWIIAGVSLALPLLTGLFGGQSDAAKKTAGAVDSYKTALEGAQGAINDTTRAAAAKAAQDAGLLAVAQQLHIPLTQVTDAITSQGTALTSTQTQLQAYVGAHTKLVYSSGKFSVPTKQIDDEGKAALNALNALNGLSGQTVRTAGNQAQLSSALQSSADAAKANADRLQGLASAASAGNTQINLLKGALDALTGKALSLGDAEVAVTNSVDAATTALKGKKGALVDATGAVNLHTAAGAALWQSMTQIASADNTLIATMEKQGATASEVAGRDAQLRGQFIATAQQMGLTAGQAQNLANQIYGIPSQRNTEITADTAAATQAVATLQARIAAIQSKTVTVTVRGQVVGDHVAGFNGQPGGTQLANARGNIVHAYAAGGIEPNMSAGIAQIVPPQTYRVIGDRITDDEAYIPINNSLRSLQILSQTAGRMGQSLAPVGASGGSAGPAVFHLYDADGVLLGSMRGQAESVVFGTLTGMKSTADAGVRR